MIVRSRTKDEQSFLVDMHIHTHFSGDSFLLFEEVLVELSGKVDGLIITDHDIIADFLMTKEDITNQYQLIAFSPAIEISSTEGHILAYGCSVEPSKELEPEEVIALIHAENGLAVAAHPFAALGVGELVYDLPFDAIEINGLRTAVANRKAREAAAILDLPCIGGSDAHSVSELASCVTQFEKRVTSMDELIKEIKKGKCKPRFL